MNRFSSVILVLLLAQCNMVWANTYTVISYLPANPPYNISAKKSPSKGKVPGIFNDIFTQVSRITGDKFVALTLPVARAHREFELGNVDIEPGVNPKWRLNAKVHGLYSVSFADTREVVVFIRGAQFEVSKPQDLFGREVGVVRGFSYPRFDAYFASGKIFKISNVSQEALIQQLIRGRLSQIFVGKATIEYRIKTQPELSALVVGNEIAGAQMMMRLHPSKAELMPRLNKALTQLKDDGVIEAIFAKYR